MPIIDVKTLNNLLEFCDVSLRFDDDYCLNPIPNKPLKQEETSKSSTPSTQDNNEEKTKIPNAIENETNKDMGAFVNDTSNKELVPIPTPSKGLFIKSEYEKFMSDKNNGAEVKIDEIDGGAPISLKKYFKLDGDEYIKEINKLKTESTVENMIKILKILNKVYDFHLWYDDTSKKFMFDTVGPSPYLTKITVKEEKEDEFKGPFYGGDNESDKVGFYKRVIDCAFKVMEGSATFGLDALFIMYCLGKNVNYWMAKRYMMMCCGNIRPNLEESLYTLVKDNHIEIITSKRYNELLRKINEVNEVSLINILMMYQYEMFNGYANTNDLANKYTGTDDTYKKIMKLVFDRVKNTFYQDKKETIYKEKGFNPEPNYGDGLSITSLVKTLSTDQSPKSFLQRQKEGEFFSINNLKELGTKFPGVLRGGKMFCGGADIKSLYNGKDLYQSIFNNIEKKMAEKKQSFNDIDRKKITALIDKLGEYEEIIYKILANMNKYITSDMPNKHEPINYQMMANAVEQYENVMKKYNHKSYVLFKDLIKLNNFVQQLKVDVMRGDM